MHTLTSNDFINALTIEQLLTFLLDDAEFAADSHLQVARGARLVESL